MTVPGAAPRRLQNGVNEIFLGKIPGGTQRPSVFHEGCQARRGELRFLRYLSQLIDVKHEWPCLLPRHCPPLVTSD
jgi:hypothetical protein